MKKTASVYAHDTAPVQASKGTKLAWLPHTLILSVAQVSRPGQGSEKHVRHTCFKLREWLQISTPALRVLPVLLAHATRRTSRSTPQSSPRHNLATKQHPS
jgi:hypothetical protein